MLRRCQKSPNAQNQASISPINRDLRNTLVACFVPQWPIPGMSVPDRSDGNGRPYRGGGFSIRFPAALGGLSADRTDPERSGQLIRRHVILHQKLSVK